MPRFDQLPAQVTRLNGPTTTDKEPLLRTFHRIGATVAVMLCALGAALGACVAPSALAASPRSPSGGHVTILVLDMSGSMAQNDPNGNRCSAANAYIDLSGPGDFIGVVGLDNATGSTGGAHNFVTAQTWAQPTEMNTFAARQALRATIAQKSNNCKPDGDTPTYDALHQALGMLQSATQGGISGSVVLLTDGTPYPNTGDQVNAIKSDLVPQFKSKGWPVDTVALGPAGAQNGVDFHGFLGDLANGTGGKFYDDGKGVVPGVSPLNLAPFFVDIFALRNGRTPVQNVAPTHISGSTAGNFDVGDFVSHLDVIAVKDNPNTSVSITDPNGHRFASTSAGVFVSTDPHYVIFSIDNPQSGHWQYNASGSGQFLMDSLLISTLTLNLTSPGKSAPLGQPVTITAALRDQGNAVVGQQFDVKAVISFAGNGTATPVEVLLTDPNGTGNYTGTVTIPLDAPAGTYEIDVTAHSSADTVVSKNTVQFAKFPAATLLAPDTGKPTTKLISAHVLQWDAGLRFIYSTLPLYSSTLLGWHPSDWPLGGLAATPNALIDGEVLLGGNVYSGATVKATEVPLSSDGSCQVSSDGTPVMVMNDGNGYFRLLFPTGARGSYCVTLTTEGSYQDSFGALTTEASPVAVTIGLPSLWDEIRAWLITLLYTVALAFITIFGIYGPINYAIRAKPNGKAVLVDMGMQRIAQNRSQLDPGRPLRWRGLSLRRYFLPDHLPGGEVTVPNNLVFIFRRGNEVQVKVKPGKRGDPGAQWQIDGRTLTPADGAETIVDRMKLSYSEAGQKTDLRFEQQRDTPSFNGSSGTGTGDIRDKLDDLKGRLPGQGRARRD